MYAIPLPKNQDFGFFCNSITLLTHVYAAIRHDPHILIPCFAFVRQCLLPKYII